MGQAVQYSGPGRGKSPEYLRPESATGVWVVLGVLGKAWIYERLCLKDFGLVGGCRGRK